MKTAMKATSVPVINIGQLDSRETLRALDSACRNWGFFQVVEHGIDTRVISVLQSAMTAFFQQSLEEKSRIARNQQNHWGFYDKELTKNVRDWKQIFDYGPAAGDYLKPQWPAKLAAFQPAVLDYYAACRQLCLRLLSAIASTLGAPSTELTRGFGDAQTSFVRLNYYPPCPQSEARQTLGISPHTDAGALTCLLQDDQAGLEVYKDGHWRLVEPRRDALVINIGDIVQVWSNDRYRAALHRVITNSSKARYSAPFFLNPAYSTNYQPLRSVVDDLHPARYKAINWGGFRGQRANGDYADCGGEIQISHYLREEIRA
jgi:isopenicillin N synthase-like dioxygenase